MLQEKIVLSHDEAISKGRTEGRAEQARETAKSMILENEPAEKIERYTGLTLEVIKPLAKSLGITLAL